MTRDIDGMMEMLEEIIDEYKRRDELLYSPRFQKATDAKSVRKLYPSDYHLFQPIFLIIDEYARFAESSPIQKMVTEIVETAGFVNIHVIIASQRPDAATVLRPRIRANLLCRMAFTTADRKNSEVILDREGAEKLGKIAGRGMLLDSDLHVIQVPYLDVIECDKLLEEYRNEQTSEGSIDNAIIEQIQSDESESDSISDLLEKFKSDKCGQSSLEEDVFGYPDFTGPEGEG
jgi:DNA segregation ATPase FtsK/SpoIIIE-like protein